MIDLIKLKIKGLDVTVKYLIRGENVKAVKYLQKRNKLLASECVVIIKQLQGLEWGNIGSGLMGDEK